MGMERISCSAFYLLVMPCLAFRVGRLLHLPSTEAVSVRPNGIPKCNHKVTSNGYKAAVSCKAKTSTKALVTCSKCFHGFGQLLVRSYSPDCRYLSGHQSKAPPPRQGGWPRWGHFTSLSHHPSHLPVPWPGQLQMVPGQCSLSSICHHRLHGHHASVTSTAVIHPSAQLSCNKSVSLTLETYVLLPGMLWAGELIPCYMYYL